MQLTDDDLDRFIAAHHEDTGETLSRAEAGNAARAVLAFYEQLATIPDIDTLLQESQDPEEAPPPSPAPKSLSG